MGPFGGQELGSLPAGPLQLQGMLKRVDAVLISPGTGRFAGCLAVLRMAGRGRAVLVQASTEHVLGWDPPMARLTGGRAWLLPGAREAPRAQVAADGRGRDTAYLRGLGDGEGRRLLGVIAAPLLIGSPFLVAHLRSLSRPAVRLRPRPPTE